MKPSLERFFGAIIMTILILGVVYFFESFAVDTYRKLGFSDNWRIVIDISGICTAFVIGIVILSHAEDTHEGNLLIMVTSAPFNTFAGTGFMTSFYEASHSGIQFWFYVFVVSNIAVCIFHLRGRLAYKRALKERMKNG